MCLGFQANEIQIIFQFLVISIKFQSTILIPATISLPEFSMVIQMSVHKLSKAYLVRRSIKLDFTKERIHLQNVNTVCASVVFPHAVTNKIQHLPVYLYIQNLLASCLFSYSMVIHPGIPGHVILASEYQKSCMFPNFYKTLILPGSVALWCPHPFFILFVSSKAWTAGSLEEEMILLSWRLQRSKELCINISHLPLMFYT